MRPWQERVVVGFLDEPPFGMPAGSGPGVAPDGRDGRPSGCDMDLAQHVLTAAGARRVDHTLTTFPELLPGLLDGRWHVTTPIFVTPERAEIVDFSRPVWAADDGFVVRRDDAGRYTSYEAIAASPGAVLAVVQGQVQGQTARRAGVPRERIVELLDQDAAAAAVRSGRADAAASTAAGNRAFVQRLGDAGLAAVTDASPVRARRERLPVGAFAFGRSGRSGVPGVPGVPGLREAVDTVLDRYLGTAAHLELMAAYGFSAADLRSVLDRPA